MKRYRTLFQMKTELKALAATIRAHRRSSHRERFEYRHLHIARCLIKGRTIDEIESPVVKIARDEKYLQKLVEKWKPLHEAEMAETAAELATTA